MIRGDTVLSKIKMSAGPVLVLAMLLSLVIVPSFLVSAPEDEVEHAEDRQIDVPDNTPAPTVDNTPPMNGARVVVLADSTASLGEGKKLAVSTNGCTHYDDAWPELLRRRGVEDIADMSCAGTKIEAGIEYANMDYIGRDTENVIIAYGSNDLATVKKGRRDVDNVSRGLRELVDTIRAKSDARIVLNGYIEFDNSNCGGRYRTRRAEAIKSSHSAVNSEMELLAGTEGDNIVYVPPPPAPRLCDDNTIITQPGSDRGYIWHNNSRAHELIANNLERELLPPHPHKE